MTNNPHNRRIPLFVTTLLKVFLGIWATLALARVGMLALLYFGPDATATWPLKIDSFSWAYLSGLLTLPNIEALLRHDIIQALYIGFKFDGRLAVFLLIPLAIVLAMGPLERRLRLFRPLLDIIYLVIFAAVIIVYFTDIGFFFYEHKRLDATIIPLVRDMAISADMVWQSYPVEWIMAGYALLVLLAVWRMDRAIAKHKTKLDKQPTGRVTEEGTWRFIQPMSWKKRLVWAFAMLVLFFGIGYAQISSNLFPLRWSDAYFSVDRNMATLALNPVQNLIDTFRAIDALRPDVEAVRDSYPRVAAWLGVPSPDTENFNLWRETAPKPNLGKPRNVVIIFMESMSWPMTSFAPGDADPTPNLRKLAEQGLLFTNFYAPSRTTARAIFSAITGIPDVNHQGGTTSRNQNLVDQFTIFNEFTDYTKKYHLGGSASWANIRGMLTHNIDGLELREESFWKAPNVDVWGISDLDLFRESVDDFNATSQPFIAFIQTAGFHRPYTIPEDNADYEHDTLTPLHLANYGFQHLEEYNSLRFSDHALGEFFRLASKEPWFENTIFAITGDHGLGNNAPNMPLGYQQCYLQSDHVPLVLYAPGLIQPGVKKFPAGHADLFPTLATLTGIGFRNHTLGRNLLDPTTEATAAQFISGGENYWKLVEDNLCYIYSVEEGLFDMASPTAENLIDKEPERSKAMRQKAKDMNVMSKYLLFNNKKESASQTSTP